MEKQLSEISWGSALKLFLVALLFASVYFFRDLIALFVSAIIIATVVEVPIGALMRRGVPRFLAVTLIYLGFLAAFSLFAYILTPVVVSEFQGFADTVLHFVNRIFHLNFLTPDAITQIRENILQLFQGIGQGAGAAFKFASRFVNATFSLVVVFVTSFYLALQGRTIEKIIKLVAPPKHESYFLGLWERAQKKIGRWFYGQVALSFTVGATVFFGLWLLGVNYPLLLGILAGILEIVPVVGPIISGLLAFAIAAQGGADLAIYTIILFVIIQQLENNILVPTVMRKSIGLNPVVVVFAIMIGGKLAGIWGVILAVPLTAALGELISDWENRKFLSNDT